MFNFILLKLIKETTFVFENVARLGGSLLNVPSKLGHMSALLVCSASDAWEMEDLNCLLNVFSEM